MTSAQMAEPEGMPTTPFKAYTMRSLPHGNGNGYGNGLYSIAYGEWLHGGCMGAASGPCGHCKRPTCPVLKPLATFATAPLPLPADQKTASTAPACSTPQP